ncbi:Flavone 3'-O-methyltransferase 1 [Nymphaea thermarum]|nr:Flavone 3'-O-methyltransferase 1 [Nymphaea thermarum]
MDEQSCFSAWHLVSGSVLPMALKAAIEMGLLEVMAKAHLHEGIPLLTSHEIAARLSAKNPDAPALLERLLRLLASHSILSCSTTTITNNNHDCKVQWRYGLGDKSRFLLGDENGLWRFHGSPCSHVARQGVHGVMVSPQRRSTGRGDPFNRAYGMNIFDYHEKDLRFSKLFNNGMHHHSTIIMNKILEIYTGFHGLLRTLVDVGGGTSTNLGLITARYLQIKGFNIDLPHVVQEALNFPGVQHVGGDMFASVPSGDAIFMKWILHDWDDDHCLKLLENCWKALPENGKVIIAEMVLPETVDNSLSTSAVFQLDLLMLALNHGGKERTEKEFEGLAKAAGFTGIKAISMHPTRSNNNGLDEQACLSAWHLVTGSVLPMALKAAMEMGLFEVMAKAHQQEGIPLLTSHEIAA